LFCTVPLVDMKHALVQVAPPYVHVAGRDRVSISCTILRNLIPQ
jgi:hypothetical protein